MTRRRRPRAKSLRGAVECTDEVLSWNGTVGRGHARLRPPAGAPLKPARRGDARRRAAPAQDSHSFATAKEHPTGTRELSCRGARGAHDSAREPRTCARTVLRGAKRRESQDASKHYTDQHALILRLRVPSPWHVRRISAQAARRAPAASPPIPRRGRRRHQPRRSRASRSRPPSRGCRRAPGGRSCR